MYDTPSRSALFSVILTVIVLSSPSGSANVAVTDETLSQDKASMRILSTIAPG